MSVQGTPLLAEGVTEWFKSGNAFPHSMCRKDREAGRINPTLVRPGEEEWCLAYNSCPFDGYLPYLG